MCSCRTCFRAIFSFKKLTIFPRKRCSKIQRIFAKLKGNFVKRKFRKKTPLSRKSTNLWLPSPKDKSEIMGGSLPTKTECFFYKKNLMVNWAHPPGLCRRRRPPPSWGRPFFQRFRGVEQLRWFRLGLPARCQHILPLGQTQRCWRCSTAGKNAGREYVC